MDSSSEDRSLTEQGSHGSKATSHFLFNILVQTLTTYGLWAGFGLQNHLIWPMGVALKQWGALAVVTLPVPPRAEAMAAEALPMLLWGEVASMGALFVLVQKEVAVAGS